VAGRSLREAKGANGHDPLLITDPGMHRPPSARSEVSPSRTLSEFSQETDPDGPFALTGDTMWIVSRERGELWRGVLPTD
jgi:hypothetical protein